MARFILSTATLKAIKCDDSRGRLRDGDGLYLRLFVNGGSHGWRFDCTFRGKRNTLSLGTYLHSPSQLGRLHSLAQHFVQQQHLCTDAGWKVYNNLAALGRRG